MSIRVTTSGALNQTLSDINKNLKLLQNIQKMLTTGNRINKPSDDPVGIITTIKLKQSLQTTDQYQTNLTNGRSKIKVTANALSTVEDVLNEILGLASDVTNSSTSTERPIIAKEISGLLDEIYLQANAKYLGKYIFGGQETGQQPYIAEYSPSGNITSVTRNQVFNGTTLIRGIDDPIYHTVAEGYDMQVNISGSKPFMPNGEAANGGTKDIFDTIIRLRDSIQNNDMTTAKNLIEEFEDEIDNVVVQETVLGERIQRLDVRQADNKVLQVDKKSDLSEVLNADYVECIMDLNYQSMILNASLQVGSKVIAPSLLDYI